MKHVGAMRFLSKSHESRSHLGGQQKVERKFHVCGRTPVFLITCVLIAVLSLCTSIPAIASGPNVLCAKGPPTPVDPRFASQLRPNQTALCSYGFDELARRLTKLAISTRPPDSVETVEDALSMPKMTTSYDNPRISSYMMSLSGKDGWRLLVWVREAFFPLDKKPDRFVPGLRPKRLGKVSDANLIVTLSLGPPGAWGSPLCMRATTLFDALTEAGWKDIEYKIPPPTDGGLPTPLFQFRNKTVSGASKLPECVQQILLEQAPMPGGRT